MSAQSNLFVDGYRYGVMFTDGSVLDRWNGHTQREHAEVYARWATDSYGGDYRPVRRRIGRDEWEPYQ